MTKRTPLPADPSLGLPKEKLIWRGSIWRHGCCSCLSCSIEYWTITNRRIEIIKGCCGSTKEIIDLRRVVDLQYHQSCCAFLTCRSTLLIEVSEGESKIYKLRTWGMKRVFNDLQNAWLAIRQGVATGGPGSVLAT